MNKRPETIKCIKYNDKYFEVGDEVSISLSSEFGKTEGKITDIKFGSRDTNDSMLVDCSEKYKSNIKEINLSRIVSINKIIEKE